VADTDNAPNLDPDFILDAYRKGFFPMADPGNGEVSWYSPNPRAIIPLDAFRTSRSLRRVVQRQGFLIRVNTSFEDVIRGCATREETWISGRIIASYLSLHRKGFAHSVESWWGEELAGGLYGVSIGGAFFGESMFSVMKDASKVALVHLVDLLRRRGFTLLDTQFINTHVRQFGATEVPRLIYMRLLEKALARECRFP